MIIKTTHIETNRLFLTGDFTKRITRAPNYERDSWILPLRTLQYVAKVKNVCNFHTGHLIFTTNTIGGVPFFNQGIKELYFGSGLC